MAILGLNSANAQSMGDLLGGALGNALEGVFSSSKIEVKDMEGQWTSSGPAVAFKGESFLEQAGGIAGAGAIEKKLEPYYKKYGLNDAKLTIKENGSFELKLKKGTLKGTIVKSSKNQDGVFDFKFTLLGMNLISLPTYVEKTSQTMNVMFDATKFKSFISAIANLTGIKLAKDLSKLLDSYKGMYVGFHFTGGSTNKSSNDVIGNVLGGLLGGSSNKSGTTNSGDSNTKTNESGSKRTTLEIVKEAVKK
ncbi:MAG: DUF4923 family protein [Muribaculaceae bacterium]|nr:DUF4923 family protein [Muribaculaceae bacterium]